MWPAPVCVCVCVGGGIYVWEGVNDHHHFFDDVSADKRRQRRIRLFRLRGGGWGGEVVD